jgi:translocation and assembly module TamB
MGTPQLSGNIEGTGLILRVSEYGIALRDGVLRATFAENRLVLDQFRMVGDTGDLTATGSLLSARTQPRAARKSKRNSCISWLTPTIN